MIAVSNAVARELRRARLTNDDRIVVVHNGVDVERFARVLMDFNRAEFLRSKELPADCLLIGSIGELRTLKRHDDFIRAAAVIAPKFPNAQFVFPGVDTSSGSEVRRQLERLVWELQLHDRFHFLGWLDDAEKLLAAMDVFVSASETESFGLAIAEAMAAGSAVVATATEGAQEVIENQKTGLLVPIGNVERISKAITTLLSHEEHRKELISRAKETVAAKFSLGRMVDEIEALYKA